MSEIKKTFLTVQDMVLIAVFTAIIAVCSWITVPGVAGQVPFTLQTFAVFVTAGVLGVKKGMVSLIVYVLLGLAGVPVFSGFTGGVGVIIGPTGGYIIGFFGSVLLIGVIMNVAKEKNETVKIAVSVIAMILGDLACFAVGTAWFMVVTSTNLVGALTMCVIPFIIPDIVKIILATIIVSRIKKYVSIFN